MYLRRTTKKSACVRQLSEAFYMDTAGLAHDQDPEELSGITIGDLKAQLAKHEGLLENLTFR